jgi:uncharacterized tellurite resistance protein B-like protein
MSMFEAFRKFIGEFGEGDHTPQFAENDVRLAAAALLVHVAGIDGAVTDVERDKLHAVLKQHFNLDDAATDQLVAQATEAEQRSIDLYRFTGRLTRSLDELTRARLVEMMWQIVFADGAKTEFEDNLVWRAADLLGISQHERIALRDRVAAQKTGETA